MHVRLAAALLPALLVAACAGGNPSNPTDAVTACTPACGGRQCGDDGCGGSCGICSSGSSCTAQGACLASTPPVQTSPNCPAGQRCTFDLHVQFAFECVGDLCSRGAAIMEYGDTWNCKTLGCQGGNSTCGTQNDPANNYACLACQVACAEDVGTRACARETADGRCWLADGHWEYMVDCICR